MTKRFTFFALSAFIGWTTLVGPDAFAAPPAPSKDPEYFSVYPEVDTAIRSQFKGQDLLIRALLERFYFMKMQKLSLQEDVKWEPYRKRFWEALYCTEFMLGNDPADIKKLMSIREIFFRVPEMKDYESLEMDKLMSNRELRRRTFKDYENIPAAEKYKFCKFPLEKSFIEKRKAELGKAEEAAFKKALKMENMHPVLRAMAQQMLKAQLKGQQPTPKQFEDTIMMLLTQVIPILETRASLEFIPEANKKCPGFIDKMWAVCDANKNDLYPKFAFLQTSKMLCAQDHRKEAPAACQQLLAVPGAPAGLSPSVQEYLDNSKWSEQVSRQVAKLAGQLERIDQEPLTKGNALAIARAADVYIQCLTRQTPEAKTIIEDLKNKTFDTPDKKQAQNLFESKIKNAAAKSKTAAHPKCD